MVGGGAGWEEGVVMELGMDMIHCYTSNGQPTWTYCRAQRALLNMWQPGWEGSLRKWIETIEFERTDTCICMADSFCCSPELSQHC